MNGTTPHESSTQAQRPGWTKDLGKVLLIWLLALLLSIPAFYFAWKRSDALFEATKERVPYYILEVRSKADLERGKMYYHEQKYSLAAFFLERAFSTNHRLLDALYYRGRVYADKGRLKEAEETFREVLTRDWNHSGARLALARLLRAKGEMRHAWSLLASVERQTPDEEILEMEYDPSRIVPAWLKEVPSQSPAYYDAYLIAGNLALDQDNTQGAEEYFEKALEVCPEEIAPKIGLYETSLAREDARAAGAELLRALNDHPKQASLYLKLQNQLDSGEIKIDENPNRFMIRLNDLEPTYRVKGVWRGRSRLTGFDVLPVCDSSSIDFKLQLHWLREAEGFTRQPVAQVLFQQREGAVSFKNLTFEALGSNLIQNPDFEQFIPGNPLPPSWRSSYYDPYDLKEGWGEIMEEIEPGKRPNHFLRLDLRQLPDRQRVGVVATRFDVKGNRVYLIGVRVRVDGGRPVIFVRWGAEEKRLPGWEKPLPVRHKDWQVHYVYLTAPEEATYCYFVIANDLHDRGSPPGNQTVDYDDAFFMEIPDATMDGS